MQLELVASGTGHILWMIPDRRRDALLGTIGCAGDLPKCTGQRVEGDRIQWRAATIDRQIGGLLMSKIINGLHDCQLNRMIRIAVVRDFSGHSERLS